MASTGGATPSATSPEAIDRAGVWFWNFLKNELSPYPGRAWVVARITVAATIIMLIVMTFRLPSGFLAAIFTLFLSRENPTATLRAGVRMVMAFIVAAAYTIVGIMTMVDDPLTHFLWIMLTLFIAFYLIRILPDYGTAVGFGFMIAGAIPLWDQTMLNINDRVENTLWLAFSVLVGSAVTIAVEYVFRGVHPATDLDEAIETRLKAVEDLLRNFALDRPLDAKLEKEITLLSAVGTSRLRRLLFRSGFNSHLIAQMNAAVSLLGRLVDLAASFQILRISQRTAPGAADQERCLRLADGISGLRRDLKMRAVPRLTDVPLEEKPSELPFLPAMERTFALIPQAFSGSESLGDFFIAAPIDEEVRQRLLVPDAFSNPEHLKFALRGMLASLFCYMVYTAIAWPGLSTSIATCVITALSTIGASRQKQFLRLLGAIIGGLVFGMGAQVFVLPYLDSIAGFTLLFAVVTAIAAWIATATPRLSYLGVQLALAYYLINLQEFTIQTSLAIARDRTFGVLLGLVSMWLLFDRLWVRNALDEMQAAIATNLRMFAELSEMLVADDPTATVRRVRELRDRINAGVQTVQSQSDAILFEFGPSRRRKLEIRDDVKRWQPSLRTALLMQITYWQYIVQQPLRSLPAPIAAARIAFEKDIAALTRAMARDVTGEITGTVPNVPQSAERLRQAVYEYHGEQGLSLSPEVSDMVSLTQNLAAILQPLYQEIHATFKKPGDPTGGLAHAALGQA